MPKRYRVEITETAEQDALEIYEFIAKDSAPRPVKWYREIEKQVRTLSRFPLRCSVIPESNDIGSEYRQLLFGDYRTIFRIEGSTIFVVRIIHGAQLLDTSTLES